MASIPRGIQKLEFSNEGAPDFIQDLSGREAGHVSHMVDAAGVKDGDAFEGQNQFLNHERYN